MRSRSSARPAPTTHRGRSLMGSDGGARARRPSSALVARRGARGRWNRLAPRHDGLGDGEGRGWHRRVSAGMPVEEFRRMIPTFLGDAVEVTPQIEDIVLSVMHVDRRGRIRPRLSRANHFRILRAIWLQTRRGHSPDSPCPRWPSSRGEGGDPDVGRAEAPCRGAGAPIGCADPDQLARGDPRPAAAASRRARGQDRTFLRTGSYDDVWVGSSSSSSSWRRRSVCSAPSSRRRRSSS